MVAGVHFVRALIYMYVYVCVCVCVYYMYICYMYTLIYTFRLTCGRWGAFWPSSGQAVSYFRSHLRPHTLVA